MTNESADLRKAVRALMFDEGVVVSRKAMDEQEKFKMCYEVVVSVISAIARRSPHADRVG